MADAPVTGRPSLLVVSHSDLLARGVAELVAPMAPDVVVRTAGGDGDGGLGTSFDAILAALTELTAAGEVVVVYDLGSALLSTQTAVEFLDEQSAGRVRIADAPLVEGALAAAVAAQGGAGAQAAALAAGNPQPGVAAQSAEVTAEVEIVNAQGLHARPAAELVRSLAMFDAAVHLRRGDDPPVDATSVLAVIAMATTAGQRLTVQATGPQARQAVDTAVRLISGGFGETRTG